MPCLFDYRIEFIQGKYSNEFNQFRWALSDGIGVKFLRGIIRGKLGDNIVVNSFKK